jgi:hypothetical protein
MMTTMQIYRSAWLIAIALTPVAALAQNAPERPQPAGPPTMAVGPQIQRIETASAVSTELLGAITSVRELPDGRVLLNDGTRRRLLIMDTTLNTVEIVLDSLSEIANAYGIRAGALIPARGDTTFFVDPASLAIVVIDEHGRIVRVRSVWRAEHVTYVTSAIGSFGYAGADAHGRIVYRIAARPAPPAVPPPAGVPYFPPQPDSAFLVAVDLDTRRLDTLTAIAIPKRNQTVRQMPQGGYSIDVMVNPMPAEDQWAIRPDGTLAIARWRDYRVDFLDTRDGTWRSSQKLPYEWQRLTDEDKQRIVDSTRVAQQRQRENSWIMTLIQWVNQYNQQYPPNLEVPDGFTPFMGLPRDWLLPPGVKLPENYIYACPPGEQPPAPTPTAAGAPPMPSCLPAPIFPMAGPNQTPPMPTIRPVTVIPPDELPDYKPPIPTSPTGAIRADFEGNLWIRAVPPKPIPGGIVYDVVNAAGELVNRIQLPPGYTLLGFGRGKIVFLSMRDPKGLHLARVRLR